MAILKVARMGHPVLREVAHPLPPEKIREPEVQRLIADMLETLAEYEGAGLAAPQVHEPVRLVVLAAEEGVAPRVLVNPELTWRTADRVRSWEGCLSVPGLRALVERVAALRVDAWDEAGERISLELEGFPAVAVQHECDHLDGILYVERCDLRTLTFTEEMRRFGGAAGGGDGEDDEETEDDAADADAAPASDGAEARRAVERLAGARGRAGDRRAAPPQASARSGPRLLRGRPVLQEN